VNVAIIDGKWPIQGRGTVSVEKIKLPKHTPASLLFNEQRLRRPIMSVKFKLGTKAAT
jgi:hypothetical protein